MKHSLPCTRSKPPPARSVCFSSVRGRSHAKAQDVGPAMQASEGDKVSDQLSKKVAGLSMIVTPSPKDVSDCISSWLAYLQMLSGLCSAGSRLSHCLGGLVQDTSPPILIMLSQCQAMWEELVRASTVASSNIKSQTLTSLQELVITEAGEVDPNHLVDTSQVVMSSLITFINLQYQFSAACCECLGPMVGCSCPDVQAQSPRHEADCSLANLHSCFQRLFPPPGQTAQQTAHRGSRSPSQVCLLPIQPSQRRWSEAAAQDVGGTEGDGTMRRWSMPWENSKINDHSAAWPGSRLHPKSKLTVPGSTSQERSRSTTPESVWHSSMASQEELQQVIQLLSCPLPLTQRFYHPGGKPVVTLTGCGFDGAGSEPWSEGTTPGSRRGSNSPHRTGWPVQDTGPHTWSDSEAHTPGGQDGNYELSPATLDPATLASRKSSSSTDSSSSYSLHSRSTTGSVSGASGTSAEGGAQEMRTHLYSMWSGCDVPFIKLPESTELVEETNSDMEPRHTLYAPK